MNSIFTDSRKWSASLQKMEQLIEWPQSGPANAPENGAVEPIFSLYRLQKMETLLSYQGGMGLWPLYIRGYGHGSALQLKSEVGKSHLGLVSAKSRRRALAWPGLNTRNQGYLIAGESRNLVRTSRC